MQIRAIEKKDLSAIKGVLDSSGLFPSEYLDSMIADYFNNPATQDIWFTTILDEKPISIAYCAPEKFTEGTYNLYAIGVHKSYQGKGIGRAMMQYLESLLKKNGHRVLIVETSGNEEFALTRKFYHQCGYEHEASIREFWKEGEDKVIFWKKLIL